MMKKPNFWSRLYVITGSVFMLAAALDPLEGSVIILIGSGLVALGTFLGRAGQRMLRFWILIFILIAIGVAVMFVLSALGGIGGRSGRSMWWGLLILPYPVGWLMGIVSLFIRLVKYIRQRRAVD